MWRIDEQVALVNAGAFVLDAALIRAMAAAGATIAVCDLAAAYHCAEVLAACDASARAKPHRSRMPLAMLLPEVDHVRSFTCCELPPTKPGTPWCCDWKEDWKAHGWQCSPSASVMN